MAENRQELNRNLAQMLKGGVINGRNNSRTGKKSQRQQAHVQ